MNKAKIFLLTMWIVFFFCWLNVDNSQHLLQGKVFTNSENNQSPIESCGNYGTVEGKNDLRVKWACEVFDRVKDAADKSETRPPRLFIKSDAREIFAGALADGRILINQETLDVCYHGTEKEEGDRRMAFILGHELAHLGNDDYMHQEAYLALIEYGESKAREKLKEDFQLPERRPKELLADKKGALYAAMAGYDIGTLFGEKNNFLKKWADQINIRYSYDGYTNYPSFEKRVHFIRSQLLAVAEQVELFKAGVLLFQTENYRSSAFAFREFANVYPAREVSNNIGSCYLHLALDHLYLKFKIDYYRFRFCTALDYSTGAEDLTPRGEGNYLEDKDIAGYLNKAEYYFKRAVDRDAQDRLCRYNLAAALILKREYAEALAVCDKVLEMDPRDVRALNNKAIALYYYGQEEELDTTRKAVGILENCHQLEPDNFEVLYNLTSIKTDGVESSGAKFLWEKYLQLKTVPKDNFYIYAYNEAKGKAPQGFPGHGQKTNAPQMPAGIELGEKGSRIAKKWGKVHVVKCELPISENVAKATLSISMQVIIKNDIRVVTMGDRVEITERTLNSVEDITKSLEKFGRPQKIIQHGSGNFYVYKDRGFCFKEINGKLHSVIWFRKGSR